MAPGPKYGSPARSAMPAVASDCAQRGKGPATAGAGWRFCPTTRRASFLECASMPMQAQGMTLVLEPPPGQGLPVLTAVWSATPAGCRCRKPAGRWRGCPSCPRRRVRRCCTPCPCADGGAARAGAGKSGPLAITLQTERSEPVRVIARVQRDDTPIGHARHGRQSWLDHPEAWDLGRRAPGLHPAKPKARRHAALSGNARGQLRGVRWQRPGRAVAGRVGADRAGKAVPSAFSAEGPRICTAPAKPGGPTWLPAEEAGGFLGGIAASGLLSGSRVRLAGTSMPHLRWHGDCWNISVVLPWPTARRKPRGRRWSAPAAGLTCQTGRWGTGCCSKAGCIGARTCKRPRSEPGACKKAGPAISSKVRRRRRRPGRATARR